MISSTIGRGALRRGLLLTVVMTVSVLVLIMPAYQISGREGLWGLCSAALLCLTPGWVVFVIHSRYGTAAPVAAFLIGMCGRLLFTLAGAITIMEGWPELGVTSFGLWLGFFYVLSLVVETKLLLTSPSDDIPAKD